MSWLRGFVFVVCSSLLVPAAAFAQEPDEPRAEAAPAAGNAVYAVVRGLSADDLLNIRAAASPLGKTIGRLPNGAVLLRNECEVVDGYEWCRVDAVDIDDLSGWAPARYLYSLAVEDAETVASANVAGEDDGAAATTVEPSADTDEAAPQSAVPIPQPAPRPAAPVDTDTASKEARLAAEDAAGELPPGLEARFAGGSAVPIDEVRAAEPRLLALSAETLPGDGAHAEDPQEEAAAGNAEQGTADLGVPVPSPRPDPGGTTTDAGETPAESGEPVAVAQAVSDMPTAAVAPSFDAADEIPCARYLGQPMARCIVRVTRSGADAADITVVWPDGGTRSIAFRDGVPAHSNGRGEFRFTREGSLNMIRIGASERFEILDALAFED